MKFVSFEQLDGLRFAIPVRSIFQVAADSDGNVSVWFDAYDCVPVRGSFDEIVARINALDVPTVEKHYHYGPVPQIYPMALAEPNVAPPISYDSPL